MKEHPIIFSGEMVRAILDGRKTQTRRIIRQQPIDEAVRVEILSAPNKYGDWACYTAGGGHYGTRKCPYGVPGDRLWVRESFTTWCDIHDAGGEAPYQTCRCGEIESVEYRAGNKTANQPRWKPSIHMPRWASRITLEITDVRVQRIQDIPEEDATAEGCERELYPDGTDWGATLVTAKDEFETLWDSLNAKRGFGWSVNPWVWAISFRRIEK